MKEVLQWLNEALATKDIGAGMTHYCVSDGVIKCTNGRITASHPWDYGGEFLVPGSELEKVAKRLKGEIKLTQSENTLRLRSGKFSGTIETMPVQEWQHPGVDEAKWQDMPDTLIEIVKALRPFISDNDAQAWATCVALDDGWAYATNNVAIAGAPCKALGKAKALLPLWAVEFIIDRAEGLEQWAWTEHYVAFRWSNGAWMRSQLVIGEFPAKAAAMVRESTATKPTQPITDEFREAFLSIAEMADDTVVLYANKIESRFGKALVEDGIKCETPKDSKSSTWGARFLIPALQAADCWQPSVWPAPAPFKGKIISGYVVGRRV